jgi:hypothetical protein
MTTSSKKKAKPVYEVTIRLGDVTVKGKGDTAYEALSSVKKPIKITGKTFVTLKEGKRTAERMLMPTAAKRLFYPLSQQYLAKQLDFLLK